MSFLLTCLQEYGIEVQYETLVCISALSDYWIPLQFILLYLVVVSEAVWLSQGYV